MPAIDLFETNATAADAPADDAFDITPDDVNELPFVTRSIYVGQGGNLTVVTRKGTTVTFYGLAAGTTLHQRVKKVLVSSGATLTTAANLVGMV